MSGYGTRRGYNKAQIDLARETNQQNREMHTEDIATQYALQDKANAFTREQFAAENAEWDRRQQATSPSAMREQYEAAGLNPYMMLGNGGAGIGSTGTISSKSGASASVPSATGMQMPNMSYNGGPLDIIMSVLDGSIKPIQALSEYVGSKAETEKTQAESRIAQSDAMYRDTYNRLGIAKLYEEYRKTFGEADDIGLKNFVFGNTLDAQIRKANGDADAAVNNAKKIETEEKVLAAGLPFIAPQALANLQNTVQDTLLKAAQTDNTHKEAVKIVAETITECLKQEGIKLDNSQKAQLMPILLEQAIADLQSTDNANIISGYGAIKAGIKTSRSTDSSILKFLKGFYQGVDLGGDLFRVFR